MQNSQKPRSVLLAYLCSREHSVFIQTQDCVSFDAVIGQESAAHHLNVINNTWNLQKILNIFDFSKDKHSRQSIKPQQQQIYTPSIICHRRRITADTSFDMMGIWRQHGWMSGDSPCSRPRWRWLEQRWRASGASQEEVCHSSTEQWSDTSTWREHQMFLPWILDRFYHSLLYISYILLLKSLGLVSFFNAYEISQKYIKNANTVKYNNITV